MGSDEAHSFVKRGSSKTQVSVLLPENRQPTGLARQISSSARLAGSAMFPSEAWRQIARNLRLSGRELQIVRGTFDDQTETSIAADLRISTKTVHTHIQRLHRKLAVTDRAQLLLCVMQEFLTLTDSSENRLPLICSSRAKGRCPLRSVQ